MNDRSDLADPTDLFSSMPQVKTMFPLRDFIRTCRSRLFQRQAVDSTGVDLTGGRLLTAVLVTRRLLVRSGVVNETEAMVGVLLPPSVAAVIANTAIGLSGKATVNLNYTLTSERVEKCLTRCAISHIITSRQFMKRRPFKLSAKFVCMEDLARQATWWDKLVCGLAAYGLPSFLLDRMFGLQRTKPDDLMTVLFTSGTTADPKGVMLSHGNIAASIDAIRRLYRTRPDDVTLGILPFFHAFGYSAALWLPFGLNMAAAYHFNPFAAKAIGEMARKYRVTVLFATPTFLKLYLRRCRADDFPALDVAVVGGEPLDASLSKSFTEKFGVTPAEGYGTTELSPWASVNVPAHRALSELKPAYKGGTVGQPAPGVQIRIIDPETHAELPNGEQGLLLVRGENVMLGYLNQPDKTAEVIHDGWYDTGDFANIDEDGFITITGRQHRFSKIGGEMVPHAAVEDAIANLISTNTNEEMRQVAVTAIPDSSKGERLIVVHTPLEHTSPTDIARNLFDTKSFPAIWIPKPADFIEVDEIPVSSLGKLDLGELKRIAMRRNADAGPAHTHAPENP